MPSLDAILRRLKGASGQEFWPNDFPTRLRIQKSIYLLKVLGYQPFSNYSFGQYIRGPYSKELADKYYTLARELPNPAETADIPDDILRPVVSAVHEGNDFLEAVATIHLYLQHNQGSTKTDALKNIGWMKPPLRHLLEGAWAFLERLGLTNGST